jgi:hypothetical protein
MKSLMVLFVASFFETHILVIAPYIICLEPCHRNHSRPIVYYARLPQLHE